MIINYKTPYYAIYPFFLSFLLSYVQIFATTPSSQIASMYNFPLGVYPINENIKLFRIVLPCVKCKTKYISVY
jgi:hypothetical protein